MRGHVSGYYVSILTLSNCNYCNTYNIEIPLPNLSPFTRLFKMIFKTPFIYSITKKKSFFIVVYIATSCYNEIIWHFKPYSNESRLLTFLL